MPGDDSTPGTVELIKFVAKQQESPTLVTTKLIG
jgi:hypothetical protein